MGIDTLVHWLYYVDLDGRDLCRYVCSVDWGDAGNYDWRNKSRGFVDVGEPVTCLMCLQYNYEKDLKYYTHGSGRWREILIR
jgi:hypothetical protein